MPEETAAPTLAAAPETVPPAVPAPAPPATEPLPFADDEPPADLGVVEALLEIGREIAQLRGAVEQLTQAVRERPELPALAGAPGLVPDEQARAAIREYFLNHRGGTIYPNEIAEELGLRVSQVVDICEALTSEGALERG